MEHGVLTTYQHEVWNASRLRFSTTGASALWNAGTTPAQVHTLDTSSSCQHGAQTSSQVPHNSFTVLLIACRHRLWRQLCTKHAHSLLPSTGAVSKLLQALQLLLDF